ncbi:class I SAM-dependent methyltransferase [Nonomuraea ferruginea]
MIHESPLGYLLGIEGMALLRAFTGAHGREFTEARIAEIRKFLDDPRLADAAVDVARVDPVAGYRIWSATYDGPNAAFDLDEPILHEILGAIPAGEALDAACGTGRLTALVAGHGHRVRGVDRSPEMLALARKKAPGREFLPGDLDRLPVADDAVDLVTCSLALTHVPALGPVLAEFARVLRPGGHVVLSDIHPDSVARGVVPPVRLPDGSPGRVTTYRHGIGDYLRAALAAGLRPRRCEELTPEPDDGPPPAPAEALGPWDVWPWVLTDLAPEAARAASASLSSMVIWHFQAD